MRSLVTDVTVQNELPNQLTSSFEFKTSQMSSRLFANMDLNTIDQSFSFTAESPFEAVRNFNVESSGKPRMKMDVKLNGANIFHLSGNGRFESLSRHTFEGEMSYPFLNEYMKVTVSASHAFYHRLATFKASSLLLSSK